MGIDCKNISSFLLSYAQTHCNVPGIYLWTVASEGCAAHTFAATFPWNLMNRGFFFKCLFCIFFYFFTLQNWSAATWPFRWSDESSDTWCQTCMHNRLAHHLQLPGSCVDVCMFQITFYFRRTILKYDTNKHCGSVSPPSTARSF